MLRRVARYAAAAGAAAAVTFLILWTMQVLVVGQRGEPRQVADGRLVDFVRLKREPEVEKPRREVPKRAAPQPPAPPPPMELSNVPDEAPMDLAASMPAFEAALDLAGPDGGAAAAAANDADAIPLVRVNPQYPARAMQRGIEGWVHLAFTITTAGTTTDIAVVDAEPANVFEDAAIAAVRRYKYKPKLDGGQPVERPGVEVMLSFKLNR